MTNTNDLRRLLDELSDEAPEVPTQEWLSGTRHKVRVRRRARWIGTGVAMALVLAAAIAVLPQVLRDSASDPTPVEPVPNQPREWQVLRGSDIERIIDSRMNDMGSSELKWTTKVTEKQAWPTRQGVGNTQLALRGKIDGTQFCQLPDGTDSEGSTVWLVSTVNGQRFARMPCRHWANYPPVNGRMAWPPIMRLADVGANPRQPFTVKMWLERDHEPVDVSGAEFGFALFWECESPTKYGDGLSSGCSTPLNYPSQNRRGSHK